MSAINDDLLSFTSKKPRGLDTKIWGVPSENIWLDMSRQNKENNNE